MKSCLKKAIIFLTAASLAASLITSCNSSKKDSSGAGTDQDDAPAAMPTN